MIPRAIAFAVIVMMMVAGLAASEHKATNNGLPLVHADFSACTKVHNGPIQRPDVYSARPHGRKADVA